MAMRCQWVARRRDANLFVCIQRRGSIGSCPACRGAHACTRAAAERRRASQRAASRARRSPLSLSSVSRQLRICAFRWAISRGQEALGEARPAAAAWAGGGGSGLERSVAVVGAGLRRGRGARAHGARRTRGEVQALCGGRDATRGWPPALPRRTWRPLNRRAAWRGQTQTRERTPAPRGRRSSASRSPSTPPRSSRCAGAPAPRPAARAARRDVAPHHAHITCHRGEWHMSSGAVPPGARGGAAGGLQRGIPRGQWPLASAALLRAPARDAAAASAALQSQRSRRSEF